MYCPDCHEIPSRKMYPKTPNFFVELIFSFVNVAWYSNPLAGEKWLHLEARQCWVTKCHDQTQVFDAWACELLQLDYDGFCHLLSRMCNFHPRYSRTLSGKGNLIEDQIFEWEDRVYKVFWDLRIHFTAGSPTRVRTFTSKSLILTSGYSFTSSSQVLPLSRFTVTCTICI
jgi:hypothetical protein